MKRTLSILIIALAIVSCGNKQEKKQVDLLNCFREMRMGYENDDDDRYFKAKDELTAILRDMTDADHPALVNALLDFREECEAADPSFRFFNYYPALLQFRGSSNVTATLLATHLYDATDDIVWHHHPAEDITRIVEYRNFAERYVGYNIYNNEEAKAILEPWHRKREKIDAERKARWEETNLQWEGKRTVTATSVGPIRLGSSVKDLPDSMEGYYDYILKETRFLSYAETDMAWEETHYTAWFAGSCVFDLMTTVRDMDMYDDYEQPEDTDWDEIVQFTVYSHEFVTPSGLSLQMTGDELFAAGGIGVHYDNGEMIWDSKDSSRKKEEYTGIYAEGLLFRYEEWQISGVAQTRAESLGFQGYRLESDQMSTFSRPKEIYSIADGWIEQFLENRIPGEESIYDSDWNITW